MSNAGDHSSARSTADPIFRWEFYSCWGPVTKIDWNRDGGQTEPKMGFDHTVMHWLAQKRSGSVSLSTYTVRLNWESSSSTT